jgi:LacI family repressor for deo operon, udp, cdd, tsx, nupC, and nupG
VFCYNDLLALGALRTLLTKGLRVPEDVAIIGFDDIEDGRYHTPSLSTIAPDKQQIAELAVGRLVARMQDPTGEPAKELWAEHRIQARESTLGRPPTDEIGE